MRDLVLAGIISAVIITVLLLMPVILAILIPFIAFVILLVAIWFLLQILKDPNDKR